MPRLRAQCGHGMRATPKAEPLLYSLMRAVLEPPPLLVRSTAHTNSQHPLLSWTSLSSLRWPIASIVLAAMLVLLPACTVRPPSL